MTGRKHKGYVPGMYPHKRTSAVKMADECLREWEMRKDMVRKAKSAKRNIEQIHYITFSRKIGVGALEIADILAEKLNWKAVDREVLEQISTNRSLQSRTVEDFDERYPGLMNEFVSLIFGEKSFVLGDYMRHLLSAVMQIAETGPTVFVGRAAHLMLPKRENVMAVRIVASREFRAMRIAKLMEISKTEAEEIVDREDYLQREFFRKCFHVKTAPAYEFDLVINRDHIPDANQLADIVQYAFTLKYGGL